MPPRPCAARLVPGAPAAIRRRSAHASAPRADNARPPDISPALFLWNVDAAIFLTRLERDAWPRVSEIYKKTVRKRTRVCRATTTTIPRALIRHLPTYSKPIKYVGHRTKLRYGSPACCRFRRMARKIHPAIKKLTRFSLSSNLEKALKYLGRNAQKDQRGE
jgi:hypothetical protein